MPYLKSFTLKPLIRSVSLSIFVIHVLFYYGILVQCVAQMKSNFLSYEQKKNYSDEPLSPVALEWKSCDKTCYFIF